MDDKIIVVGGINADDDVIHEIESYNPIKDTWSIVGNTELELNDHLLLTI